MKGFANPIGPIGRRVALVLAVACTVLLGACATTKKAEAPLLVLFPAPPERPRVQYLGSISSPDDLPKVRSAFADFVLGPAPKMYPLAKPISAVLQGSRLYVCDTVFNSIIVYDLSTGDAHPLAGDRAVGNIQQPNNLAFDQDGRLYVADKVREAVLVYNADESFVAAWGRPGEAKPVAVAIWEDELFVCDPDEHEVEVWSRLDGSFIRKFGGLGKEPGKFFIPTYLALDPEGNLFVTDTGNFRVQKVTRNGEPLAVIGGPGREFGKFAWPKGMDVDQHGRLYVADSRFANVQIFDKEGKLLLFFGAPGPEGGNLDLPAAVHVMPWPAIPWLQEKLQPGFDAENLAIVVNQQGLGFVNFFAIARDAEMNQ